MPQTAVAHDHVVLLLGKEDFENPPDWLTKNFHIIEGGTHAGRSSRNKLIVFKDGTYLELFNWIAAPTEFFAWADKEPGLIDFALTTMPPVTAEQNYNTISKNLSKLSGDSDIGVSYSEPLAGGRTRADGTEVKWRTTRPTFHSTKAAPDPSCFPTGRNEVPFFCHDVTDRTVRVPFDNEEITTHPCGAVGIRDVTLWVPESRYEAYLDLFRAVTDVKEPKWIMDDSHMNGAFFEIGVPNPLDSDPSYVVVHEVADDNNETEVRGFGIMTLTLRKSEPAKEAHHVDHLEYDGLGLYVKITLP